MWLFLILITFNLHAIKKEKNNFKNILLEKENNTEAYELKLFTIKSEFKEETDNLHKEIQELRQKLEYISRNYQQECKTDFHQIVDKVENEDKLGGVLTEENIKENTEKNIKGNLKNNVKENSFPKEEKRKINRENKSVRVLEMEELLKKGFTIDEVAQKLNISKGEALLIKDLYLR
ncbi:hypothetical protein [Haloimpatiens lingqiaonensis]|uniref:hypothetical protein n=1 Tax=Haloimpatiens lingqiaonensis TaxID=1380675 RepID=UPI0010FCFFBF|nr:hypothetical protein [Haloimpatiens lingqiaonensis]